MARGTDTGNFVMLLLGAGAAAAFLGDWAGKAVLWVGMIAMIAAAVAYILRSWGIDFSSPPRVAVKNTATPPSRVRVPAPSELPLLVSAVARRDRRQVEHLVLNRNLSPFENTVWEGEAISAHQLARRIGYQGATDFFNDWSAKGSVARFPHLETIDNYVLLSRGMVAVRLVRGDLRRRHRHESVLGAVPGPGRGTGSARSSLTGTRSPRAWI